MARDDMKHRAVAAGLGGAVALAVPAAAIAVFKPVSDLVPLGDAGLVPFAAGTFTGVAVMGVVAHFALRATEQAYERAYEADGEPAWEERADAAASAEPVSEPEAAAEPAQPQRRPHRPVFGRRRDDDVPVIARAEGALSEEEAWAEIDAALTENPSISCDPVRSKDIYELAFEELASRSAEAPAEERDPEPAVAPAVAALPVEAAGAEPDAAPVEVEQHDFSGREDMWAEALSVLMGDDAELTASMAPVEVPAPEAAVRGAHFSAAAPAAEPASPSFVPAGATGVMYVPAHAVPVTYVSARDAARAESLSVQERVNEMIEEEFSKSRSQSVRATSKRYLSVVNGGTASWSRLETKQA